MTEGDASASTGRTGSQALENTEAPDPALAARGAPAAPLLTENGAHMGRGALPDSEVAGVEVQELAERIAEAAVAGEFELARALTEEAIRVRAGAPAPGGPDTGGLGSILHKTKPEV